MEFHNSRMQCSWKKTESGIKGLFIITVEQESTTETVDSNALFFIFIEIQMAVKNRNWFSSILYCSVHRKVHLGALICGRRFHLM